MSTKDAYPGTMHTMLKFGNEFRVEDEGQGKPLRSQWKAERLRRAQKPWIPRQVPGLGEIGENAAARGMRAVLRKWPRALGK